MANEKLGATVRRFVPIVSWLPRYEKAWLSGDVIAGFTIWGLLIPEMIAYASLAGLPPQAGLYTLLGLTRPVCGVRHEPSPRRRRYIGVGGARVLGGDRAAPAGRRATTPRWPRVSSSSPGSSSSSPACSRLGFITQFLSRPVMAGFVFGLAIFVTVSQLPKLFGIEKGEGDTIRQLAHIIDNLGSTSVVTLAVGVAALVAALRPRTVRAPNPGRVSSCSCSASPSAASSTSPAMGSRRSARSRRACPRSVCPDLSVSELWVLIPSALGMVLVIFSEALGAAETFAEKHHYRIDPNQEMIALGAANLGSGLLGGLAGGGSLSQTAVNEGAGARSEMSPIFASVLSLVTVIALTPLFKDLPEAVLGALIIHAVSKLMKVAEMRSFYRLVPREFYLGLRHPLGCRCPGRSSWPAHRRRQLHPSAHLPCEPTARLDTRRGPRQPGHLRRRAAPSGGGICPRSTRRATRTGSSCT